MSRQHQQMCNPWPLVLGLNLTLGLGIGGLATFALESRAEGLPTPIHEYQARQETVATLQAAAARGDVTAEYRLGMRFLTGHEVTRSEVVARQWFEKAAQRAHPAAAYQLGGLYLRGRETVRNEQEAFRWYQKAAELMYPAAEYNVGLLYANGTGVDRDEAAAVRWLTRAADRGYRDAQYKLAMMYAIGRGVPKDAGKARALYNLAAEPRYEADHYRKWVPFIGSARLERHIANDLRAAQENAEAHQLGAAAGAGEADALNALGSLHANSVFHDAADDRKAAEYYRRAAFHGSPEGLRVLGEMYWHGRGVVGSRPKALALLSMAAARGDADAAETVGLVANELTEDERSDSSRLALDWPSGSEWSTPDSRTTP